MHAYPPRRRRSFAGFLCFGLLIGVAAAPGSAARRIRALTEVEWQHEVARRGVDPASVPFPLAYTPEMHQIALAAVGGPGPLERLQRLQDLLFDPGRFPFDYDSRQTYTAIEAFESRRGNCVSFTNLFIALSRALGLPVRAALPTVRGDAEREGNLVVINTHVVAVYEKRTGFEVFDFSRRRERQVVGLRLIDDLWVTALYLNNLGVQELIAGNPTTAAVHLEAAVRLAPDFAAAYGNLGVARRRLGDDRGAIEAHRAALELAPGDSMVLMNLAALYDSQGRAAEARAALETARLRGATPFLLILRGDFELAKARYGRALHLYRRAARAAPNLPDPQLAIARAEMARGRTGAARKALRRALEIDPESRPAARMLGELAEAADSPGKPAAGAPSGGGS